MTRSSAHAMLRDTFIFVLATTFAILASFASWPISPSTPWVFFFAAVLASARIGGKRSSYLTIVALTICGRYFFMQPYHSVSVDRNDSVLILIFVTVLLVLTYLTEARRRFVQFERSERKWFHAMVSSIGDAVITTDALGKITFLNPVAKTLTGWPNQEAIGQSLEAVFRIVKESDGKPAMAPIDKVLATGTIVGLENPTSLISRDGTKRAIEDSVAPIRLSDGSIVGTVLVFRDVTEKRSLERERIESERRLSLALDSARMVAWQWNPANGSLHVSENAAEVYGLPLGTTLLTIDQGLRLLHPDDVDAYTTAYSKAIEERSGYLVEYRLIRPDNHKVLWMEERGDAVDSLVSEKLRLAGVTMDITERKEAEELLRKSEERYRSLFNTIDEGFCVIEMIHDEHGMAYDYRFLEVNPAFQELTGWSDVVGKTVREITPNSEPFWQRTYDEVARTGTPVRLEHFSKALVGRHFDVSAFRIGNAAEPKVAILFSDITARKQSEQERERLLEQLREADRRKDEFLAMLGHELRNPLSAIGNAVQLSTHTGQREHIEWSMEVIVRQMRHLTRLIDDLLDVSRINRGKIELRKTLLEITPHLDQVVATVTPFIEARGQSLDVSLERGKLWLDADSTRLSRSPQSSGHFGPVAIN